MKSLWPWNIFSNRTSTDASTSNSPVILTKRPSDIVKLNDSVWEFYKPDTDQSSPKPSPKLEILFFHGAQLVNDPEVFWLTWLSRDGAVVWPTSWLTQEFPRTRLLFISYDSSIQKSSQTGDGDTYLTVENLIQDIICSPSCKAGQNCPVIFAGHCFGGIIIKDFLLRCHDYANIKHPGDSKVKEIKMFLQQCKGIFYYSVPNEGSSLADRFAYQGYILGNVNESLVDFIKILSKHTARININFSDLRHNHHPQWKIHGVGELLETKLRDFKKRRVVTEASARQGVDNMHMYWVAADHFDISKAKDKKCKIFTGLSDLVAECYNMPSSTPTNSQPPDQIWHSMRQCFDNLSNVFKGSEVTTAIQSPTLRNRPRLDFKRDESYVRLEAIEKAARTSLIRLGESNRKLVLLHGGTGRGKSCLARDLALQIQSPDQPAQSTLISDLSSHAAARHITSTTNDPVSDVDRFTQLHQIFEDVVFLDCGLDKDLSVLQRELRQWLGGWSVEVVSNLDLQESIERLLRSMKLLIVLDDVWNPELLQKMLYLADEAPNVKFLVTSQDPDLCTNLRLKTTDGYVHVPVPMGNASRPDAMEILARHIFWPDPEDECSITTQSIPQHPEILKCANDIIDMVDENLLAIACLGGAARFNSDAFQNPEKWKEALDGLEHWRISVPEGSTKWVLRKPPPRDYFAAIHFAFERLDDNQKMLLALAAFCRGPSVHKDIIEYLYYKSGLQTSRETLNLERLEQSLKGRQLLRIEGCRYSVHYSLRLFIKERFKLEYEELFVGGLSQNDKAGTIHKPEKDILGVMCVLYLEDRDYAERIVETLEAETLEAETLEAETLEAETRIMTEERPLIILSHIIEGVSLLAVKEQSKNWTPEMQLHSRKVFLSFISGCLDWDCLDWQGTEFLLRQPLSRGHMARALFNLFLIQQISESNGYLGLPEEIRGLPEEILLPLLEISTEEQVFGAFDDENMEVVTALTGSSMNMECVTAMIGSSMLISGASDSLKRNDDIRKCATTLLKKYFEGSTDNFFLSAENIMILGSLAPIFQALNISHEHVNPQKTIKKLVFALVQSPDARVRSSASTALNMMAKHGGQGLCREICDTPESLSNLVDAIGKEDVPDLPVAATLILWLLVEFGDKVCCQYISSVTGALQALVHAIARSQDERLPLCAVDVLARLASKGGENLCEKICRTKQSISNLVTAMRKQDVSQLQLFASRALFEIATNGEIICCQIISSVAGAIEAMVDAIAGGQNGNGQEFAASALATVSFRGGEEVCKQICETRTSLSKLVAAMNNENVPFLQHAAAIILSNLTHFGGNQCSKKLSSVGGVIEALVGGIAGNKNADVPEFAARILHTLASHGGQDFCNKICKIAGSVAKLVAAMGRGDIPGLQYFASMVLHTLAENSEKELCKELLRDGGTIQALVDAIAKSQVAAAETLFTLAVNGGEDASKRIYNTPGNISKLVNAMSRKEPQLQYFAALILFNIAIHGGKDCCKKMSNVKGVIPALVAAVAGIPNEIMSLVAAGTLRILVSCGGHDVCKKICKTGGSVSNLIDAMGRKDVPDLQHSASIVLEFLAKHDREEFCKQMSSIRGAIQSLVDAIAGTQTEKVSDAPAGTWTPELFSSLINARGKQDIPHLQSSVHPAYTILMEHYSMKEVAKLSSVGGPIEGLFNANARSRKLQPEFSSSATATLAILASHGGPGLCKEIVAATHKENVLNVCLIPALYNLALRGEEACCHTMSNVRGAIQRLVDAIVGSHNGKAPAFATLALTFLALQGGQNLSKEICKTPRSISNLVAALGKKDVPDLQFWACYALCYLGEKGGGDFWRKLQASREQ